MEVDYVCERMSMILTVSSRSIRLLGIRRGIGRPAADLKSNLNSTTFKVARQSGWFHLSRQTFFFLLWLVFIVCERAYAFYAIEKPVDVGPFNWVYFLQYVYVCMKRLETTSIHLIHISEIKWFWMAKNGFRYNYWLKMKIVDKHEIRIYWICRSFSSLFALASLDDLQQLMPNFFPFNRYLIALRLCRTNKTNNS